jgi:hypothetical protein
MLGTDGTNRSGSQKTVALNNSRNVGQQGERQESMFDSRESYPRSYLFTVRLWSEEMGSAGTELRGEVRHVLGGGVCYFAEWTALVSYLAEKLQELETQKGGDGMTYQTDM